MKNSKALKIIGIELLTDKVKLASGPQEQITQAL